MARTEVFRLPSLGADMDEATLLEWRVAVGDQVSRGEVVAVVDTEKSEIDVEIWQTGRVSELLVEVGRTIPVGTPMAVIDTGSPGGPAHPPSSAPAEAPAEAPDPTPTPPTQDEAAGPRVLSPLVRHLAERHGIDLATVAGSGPGGIITRHDVELHATPEPTPAASTVSAAPTPRGSAVPLPPRPIGVPQSGPERGVAASPLARRLAHERGVDLDTLAGRGPGGAVVAADVPVETGAGRPPTDRAAAMRRAIAELMARSKREIPHYYLATDLDCTEILAALERLNADRPPQQRILPAAAILWAVARAARKVPALNGYWVHDGFEAADHVHLGVAVAMRGGGLVAPAIQDADRLDLDATMAALRSLVERARAGRLRSSEMSSPTITVSNLGERGVTTLYGVVYPPQVGLVGVGAISERPAVVDGRLEVVPMATMTLSADHRATDGQTGSRFLAAVERQLGELARSVHVSPDDPSSEESP